MQPMGLSHSQALVSVLQHGSKLTFFLTLCPHNIIVGSTLVQTKTAVSTSNSDNMDVLGRLSKALLPASKILCLWCFGYICLGPWR